MRKCLTIWAVLILVSAGVAFAQAPSVITVTQEVSSGMFTLASTGTTTAKVNVLNLGGLSFPTNGTCAATVSLWNSSGTQVTGSAQTITVGSGAAGSATFSTVSSVPFATLPGLYRVVISYPLTPSPVAGGTVIPVRASCSLVPTLELIGTSGTTAYITQFYGVPQILPLSPLLSRP